MRTAYVLMYKDNDKMVPYAVFDDSITAEKMKRDGDEVVKVPYFEDRAYNQLYTTSPNSIQVMPCNDHVSVTYSDTNLWGKDSTLAPPESRYPKVTCQKTVDEHSWTNRVD